MTFVRSEECRTTLVPSQSQLPLSSEISRLASAQWGGKRPTVLIGLDDSLRNALDKIAHFAASDSPVLLTGETGTGKELFARALFLLSRRRNRPYLCINCAQYHDGQLMASELFGHKRGSFTGAVSDHRGVFEEADTGTVFLDEIGELSLGAQAMLLRALSESEIVPVGGTQARVVDVRVVAATSRDLRPAIAAGTFRADLYYRLKHLHVAVPPVRERGDDWEHIAAYYLSRLNGAQSMAKRLSSDARSVMRGYHWPGNVRELRSVVDVGFHLSAGNLIEPRDFAEELETLSRREQLRAVPFSREESEPIARLTEGRESFWDVVYKPFMNRDLSRAEAREIVAHGLDKSRGSYKKLLELFGVSPDDYLKFMDFLRHQKLKPD
jgi:transcriptional regulator with GAF, ATPase, and Fis domain